MLRNDAGFSTRLTLSLGKFVEENLHWARPFASIKRSLVMMDGILRAFSDPLKKRYEEGYMLLFQSVFKNGQLSFVYLYTFIEMGKYWLCFASYLDIFACKRPYDLRKNVEDCSSYGKLLQI